MNQSRQPDIERGRSTVRGEIVEAGHPCAVAADPGGTIVHRRVVVVVGAGHHVEGCGRRVSVDPTDLKSGEHASQGRARSIADGSAEDEPMPLVIVGRTLVRTHVVLNLRALKKCVAGVVLRGRQRVGKSEAAPRRSPGFDRGGQAVEPRVAN